MLLALRTIAALALALVAGCAQAANPLPPEARGSTWLLDPAQRGATDLISYRALRRQDYRAAAPPPQARGQAARLGAVTCSYLVPDRDHLRIRAVPRQRRDGRWEYIARPDQLRFHGAMDRRCSWWNDRQAQLPGDYVLQHEQIHFALTEIHARRLNTRAKELAERATAIDLDADAAIARVQQAIDAILREEGAALLARNDRFDADTSLGYRPEQQAAWKARIERELAETRSLAR